MEEKAGWRFGDRRVPARVRGEMYGTVVRPAMPNTALTKRQEVAELRTLRFSLGVDRECEPLARVKLTGEC